MESILYLEVRGIYKEKDCRKTTFNAFQENEISVFLFVGISCVVM